MSPVPFAQRPQGDVICLFDVDGTLTPARRSAAPEMLEVLKQVRQKAVIGFVGGSDLPKITEQLAINGQEITDDFDFCFAENGLTAIKLGQTLESQSFIKWIGEEKYKKLVRFVLHYVADLDIPIKRGTFIEFRNAFRRSVVTLREDFDEMSVNGPADSRLWSHNYSVQERDEFEKYDKVHKVRAAFVEALKKEFADYGLTYSIGGQISFDVFPAGWDKTYALKHIANEGFKEIHFFGDKTYQGGNDYEIYTDDRTIGHSVTSPQDTMNELRQLFKL
ncbi:Phosphomannomutase 1 [Microbotryomycetes sp. JL201]|nr:Phosphomannomutase 1 [Microbotryomycetes sp. JL201]